MAGGTVTDAHTAAAGPDGQEFALLTAGRRRACLLLTDAAQVTITPPAGSALHLDLPGFYFPRPGPAPGRGGLPGAVRRLRPRPPPAAARRASSPTTPG